MPHTDPFYLKIPVKTPTSFRQLCLVHHYPHLTTSFAQASFTPTLWLKSFSLRYYVSTATHNHQQPCCSAALAPASSQYTCFIHRHSEDWRGSDRESGALSRSFPTFSHSSEQPPTKLCHYFMDEETQAQEVRYFVYSLAGVSGPRSECFPPHRATFPFLGFTHGMP